MKNKLFFFIILSLISFVAYQKYAEYSSLKSINSYESCIAAKSSMILESYPTTCVTRLGNHFPQLTPDQSTITPPIFTKWLHSNELVKSKYSSSTAKLTLTFSSPVYVSEVFDSSDDINGLGYITISKYKDIENGNSSYMQISYGVPFIDGKGGACIDHDGNGVWTSSVILNQKIDTCDQDQFFSAGYTKHPNDKVEYWFSIQNNDISKIDYQFYKDIIYSAKFIN